MLWRNKAGKKEREYVGTEERQFYVAWPGTALVRALDTGNEEVGHANI